MRITLKGASRYGLNRGEAVEPGSGLTDHLKEGRTFYRRHTNPRVIQRGEAFQRHESKENE